MIRTISQRFLIWLIVLVGFVSWHSEAAQVSNACFGVFEQRAKSSHELLDDRANEAGPVGRIYLVTNLKTGEVFVGITAQQDLNLRLRLHFVGAQDQRINTKFYRAIRQHGPDAFKIEAIDRGLSYRELEIKAEQYIARYDSLERGYNSSKSGEHPDERSYLPFVEARVLIQKLGLRNLVDFLEWSQSEMRLPEIPMDPGKFYEAQGWVGWSDFLGLNRGPLAEAPMLTYENARSYVQRMGLRSKMDYLEWANSENRLANLPARPDQYYREFGWTSWGDFLGSQMSVAPIREYLPFVEARDYVRGLGFATLAEYKDWAESDQRPPEIPHDPGRFYEEKGWTSWRDFLGVSAD